MKAVSDVNRGRSEWHWSQSLGAVSPDPRQTYAIRSILFGLVRDRCFELGLSEGVTVRCRSRGSDRLVVELESGEQRSLDLSYAWFVQVEPVGPRTLLS